MKKDDVLLISDYGDQIRFLEEENGEIIGYYLDGSTGEKSQPMLVDQIIMMFGDGNVGWKYAKTSATPNTPTK
jgi:hypothetical protein